MDNKAIDVSALTKKARKCQQFLNFIRQNWIAIALNIATVVICALSIQYGLSRPFDWAPSSLIMAICIIVIAGSIGGALKSTNMIIHICLMIIAAAGATTGAIFGFEYLRVIIHDEYILWPLCYVCGTIGALMGILSGYLVMCCTHNFINTLWEQHKKYCLSIVLAIVTLTVLLASSFQNVDARSWKFDRGTGKLVERVVFIWPGSTLEKEYFVVDRKPQKEVSVWIWFP
ncbi:MAG: hypothetical protein Q8K26_00740, partial [Candidatus Gracilibacteria bacterium]|nr:hypothetical protein [Candidatus Gracilibacteria bacterium]